jgi:hypothetical protein
MPQAMQNTSKAQVEMRIHNFACDAADVLVAHAGVVFALRRREAATRGKAERRPVLVQEILLLVSEPRVRVVEDGRAAVARVRGLAVGHHHFAHHEHAVLFRRIRIARDRLEHAVRTAALGLARRAAVKAPHREIAELREAREFFDLRLAAEVRDGLVAIEPNVFQFVFRHCFVGRCIFLSRLRFSGPQFWAVYPLF